MLYVSFRTSFVVRRLLVAAICSYASMSQPAFGEDLTVDTFVLTDAEIATRCAASIKGHVDMVDADEGNGIARRVPRCVATYENMRAIAEGYSEAEEAAREQVIARVAKIDCNNQQDCAEAGQKMAELSIEAHQNLVNISHDNQMHLSEITHVEVVDDTPAKVAVAPEPRPWGVAQPIVEAVHKAVTNLELKKDPIAGSGGISNLTVKRAPASVADPVPKHQPISGITKPESHKPTTGTDN
ncbi:MAG: hypothetical protein ACXVBE_07180 [Bdellovibrionota bacterium]